MPNRNIIVVGASAGGVEALSRLVQDLPPDLPAAIFVVLHLPAFGTSVLPQILSHAGELPACHPVDKQVIQPGYIYVAPSNYHLLIENQLIRLSLGPRENGCRPAVDPLFRTAAKTYKQQVIGVILSGMLDDGTAGLSVIKQCGGVAIVQDPEDALFSSMPKSAISHVEVDYILPIFRISEVLVEQTQEEVKVEVGENFMVNDNGEAELVRQDKAALEQGERPGQSSMLTCPECGGVMWELGNGDLLRYRCHTGHAYSVDSLVSEQSNAVETALWTGVRALEEKASLCRRMAVQAREQNRLLSEERFLEQAAEISKHAVLIRQVIMANQEKTIASETND